jgi:hypothetical protein
MQFRVSCEMYNVPWQDGRVFQTPIGILTASFLLRPNTMFHPEGEWSARLVLPPLQAHRLRQIIAPAHDEIVARAKAIHQQQSPEDQARRPFKENPFWQAASVDGGQANENVYFTFRLPTIDRSLGMARLPELKLLEPAIEPAAPAKPRAPRRKKVVEPAPAADGPATEGQAAAEPPAPVKRVRAARARTGPTKAALAKAELERVEQEKIDAARIAARIAAGPTRVPLLDRIGQPVSNMVLEPDGWDAMVSFTIQQYWMRSFGAGVTLRLNKVQLFGLHQRAADLPEDPDLPFKIAL